jgi:hypothetical protein
MTKYYDIKSDDNYYGEKLVRVSDGREIANIQYDCPEDHSFGRNMGPVLDELERLAGDLEAAVVLLAQAREDLELEVS